MAEFVIDSGYILKLVAHSAYDLMTTAEPFRIVRPGIRLIFMNTPLMGIVACAAENFTCIWVER